MTLRDYQLSGAQPRGNATTALRFNSTTNSWVSSTTSYDIAGNVVNVTDPNGHTTTYSYADSYSDGQNRNTYAHVTAITNALQQTHSIQYDYGTGKPTSLTDANGATTSYAYNNDPFDRLTQLTAASGAKTTYSYPSPKLARA